jgi:diguanylate cyclase (GGDEF)-like protein
MYCGRAGADDPRKVDRRRIAFRWTAWLLLAAFVALAGVTAEAWRRQVHRQNEQAFTAQAASVGASVTTAVRRMDDLTLAARTLLAAQPDLTNAQFSRWYRSMDVAHRFSGVAGFGYTQIVPHEGLKEFVARAQADPTPGNDGSPFAVFPAGSRPTYCFSRLGVAAGQGDRTLLELGVPGLDLCALTGQLTAVRDSGHFGALVMSSEGGHDLFEVIAPVYRGGGVPRTLAARRRLGTGWIIGLFDAEPILRAAVAGQPGVAVTLGRVHALAPEWRIPTGVGGAYRTLADSLQTPSQASYGRVTGGPLLHRRFSVDADGRWIVSVAHAAPPGLSSPTVQAMLVLAGWLVVGLLGFFLVRALALGRTQAIRMVEEKTRELQHQAMHDTLTGLPNRALIMDRAERMLARARRDGTQPAAMFIDLDGFKAVNDTFGHPVGDELLRAVAERIGSVLRESDTIGRLGGDEFVVLVEGEPELVAKRILAVLREPFDLGTAHGPVGITTSIGIASGGREAARDLLRDADIALYEAKGAGRNRYAEFRHEMHIAAHDRLALQTDLTHAIARDELFVVYQPVLDLESGTVVAAEALLRWQHSTRGLVPPAEFIALAEDSGLIVDVGAWVLERACAQAAAWGAHGHPIRVSVNVSARQFDDPGLLDAVEHALATSGLDAAHLTLEITETALMREADRTAAVLRALKALGVMVAIDDFGTGYSSLSYLQTFPVDALKIDQTFIAASAADPLVETLVQLGRSLGLRTVAEGIEDEAQLAHLRELGCDRGQGYLFAPPLEVEALERFLSARAAVV